MRWYKATPILLALNLLLLCNCQHPPPPSPNAFATVIRDDSQVLLARVLLQSIKTHTNPPTTTTTSKHSRVVYTSPSVSHQARQQLLNDDASIILRTLPDNSKLSYSMLFNATDVKKFIYLAPDTLVMDDLSEVFKCGTFCAAFTIPCSFHTGVMVLSPNQKTFQEVGGEYERLVREGGACAEGNRPDGLDAEGCVLNEIYGSELYDAPLFKVDDANAEREDDEEEGKGLKRLPFGCHLNHVLFYPRLRWEIPEQSCGKRKVIDFMGPSYFKPDKWWTYALLDLGDEWLVHRRALNDSTAPGSLSIPQLVWRVGLAVALVFVMIAELYLSRTPRMAQTENANSSGHGAAMAVSHLDDRLFICFSSFLIFSGWIMSVALSLKSTPTTLMPMWGALVFSAYKFSSFTIWMFVVGSVYCVSQASSEEIRSSSRSATLPRAIAETIFFGILDIVYPMAGIMFIRQNVTASIYIRLLAYVPFIVIYILLLIIFTGRVSLVWLSYGAKYQPFSLTKVASKLSGLLKGYSRGYTSPSVDKATS